MSHKAVFFDRDGVINHDFGYVGTIDRFSLIDDVPWALATLKNMGYLTILVTNQSGIARGMYTVDDFYAVTDYMQSLLGENARFDGVYFCPHHIEASVSQFRCRCSCRKPKSQMLLWAKDDFDIDLSTSIMVGDHASDLTAAMRINVPNLVLVGEHISKQNMLMPEAKCFPDLPAMVRAMLNNEYLPN